MDHQASAAFVAPPRPAVQVLTAGGAANNSSNSRQQQSQQQQAKRKRNKKTLTKSSSPGQGTSVASSSSSSSSATGSPRAEISPQTSSTIPFDDLLELEDVVHDDHEFDNLTTPNDRQYRDLDRHDADAFQSSSTETSPHKSSSSSSSPKKQPTDALSWIDNPNYKSRHDLIWLAACFVGIMASFVCYGLVLEYTTSGGRQLHELSFLFVTSGLYTLTAAAGRHVRDETPSTIPPARFALLALTSMGSTFTSVRSLRYVIYPIQVLAKSCKPVPVMLMGTLMGKRYPLGKYLNVIMIVIGVAMFMGGGSSSGKHKQNESDGTASQVVGLLLLFVSLCFDGGTGAYEDKLMSVHSVGPFDLMYNIQLGKTILAGVGLLVLNQVHVFLEMIQEMGFLLVALGLTGALGQVFIFITISKFGALTCSIIGLARKVATLVASIYYYGHHVNPIQFAGLVISIVSMVMNFWTKKKGGGGGHHHGPPPSQSSSESLPEEMEKMIPDYEQQQQQHSGDIELASKPTFKE